MDTSHIWKRVADGERTSTREAWALLRAMIDEARDRGADAATSIEDAALTVASALDRIDQRATARETLLFELRSERGRCRELDELLVRLLDRGAEDGIESLRSALAAVDDIEMAVRSSEAAFAPPPAAPASSDREVERRSRRGGLIVGGTLVLIAVLLLVFKIVSEEGQRGDPTAGEAIDGAVVELVSPQVEGGRLRTATDWATRGLATSSSFHPLERALGWPDIYRDPELDSGVVWSPRSDDGGTEFVEVAWNMDLAAKSIVVVEGPNAGAIVAVDEIRGVDENRLGAADYVRLWSGRMEPSRTPRFTLVHLPQPRPLRGLRLVLDTALVAGPNSIDAIGLIRE